MNDNYQYQIAQIARMTLARILWEKELGQDYYCKNDLPEENSDKVNVGTCSNQIISTDAIPDTIKTPVKTKYIQTSEKKPDDILIKKESKQEYNEPVKSKIFSTKQEPASLETNKEKALLLASQRQSVEQCTKCQLHKLRKNAVFGDGTMNAQLVFVGHGPSVEEDAVQLPFIGDQGILLGKIIMAMGLRRDMVYLCNVTKCITPEKQPIKKEHMEECSAYLWKQLKIISPKIIVALGQETASFLLEEDIDLTKKHGTLHKHKEFYFIPTFHPEQVLADPQLKRPVWNDMKYVMKLLESNNILEIEN